MKIVHVTPHLGTGIGAAYAGLTIPFSHFGSDLEQKIHHEILLLEKPQKPIFVEKIEQNGVTVLHQPSRGEIERSFRTADIVQVNWWNHPIMSKFLYKFPDIPIRLACWVHVSGCNYPYLRADFLDKFDQIFFTTPYSYENDEVADRIESGLWTKEKTCVLYGMSDLTRFFNVKKKEHDDFRIGYVGTLDFSKLHPDFISFCDAAASIAEDIRFVLIGDMENEPTIRRQAEKCGIEHRFEFRGFRTDISEELARIDCFGYPLNPFHFGATENVLLEALAAGIPVVALNQNTEKYIIQNDKNGFLVDNPADYAASIKQLYLDANLRDRMSRLGRKTIKEKYSVEKIQEKSVARYRSMLNHEKCFIRFDDLFSQDPSGWFLHFVQQGRREILEDRFGELEMIFKGKSKGSIRQFAACFPQDEKLTRWVKNLEKEIR